MEPHNNLSEKRENQLIQKKQKLLLDDKDLDQLNHPDASGFSAKLLQIAEISSLLKLMAGFVITALIILALIVGKEILIPLALAILFSFLLNPLVNRLKRLGLPRIAAIGIVVACTLGVLTGAGTYLFKQLASLSQQLPQYETTIKDKLNHAQEFFSGPSIWDGALNTLNTVESSLAKTVPDQDTAPNVQQVEVVGQEVSPTQSLLEFSSQVMAPLATAGIIFVFAILILLDPKDLHDRLLRMFGTNLTVGTDALGEAGDRIGNYLRMQLIVNMSYGVPMAIGLWFIGVPAAIMWGMVAIVMRFIPYVGPLICAIFPLTLAFAVDPGWNMVLWTLGLIAVLELITNNIIEPWLYGESTGLSTLAIMVAATFWTAVWGPIGLIMSTPLTACLLVLSSYIPALAFIKVLIGSAPALTSPERLYQRLVADDDEAALEVAQDFIQEDLPKNPPPETIQRKVIAFYDEVAIPAIRLFSKSHSHAARAEHRLRMHHGLKLFNRNFQHAYTPENVVDDPKVFCLGARWEVDVHASAMLAHVMQLKGIPAQHSIEPIIQNQIDALEVIPETANMICISIFHQNPLPQIRLIHGKLKHQFPKTKLIFALWNTDLEAIEHKVLERFDVDALVDEVDKLVLTVEAFLIEDGIVEAPELSREDDQERSNMIDELELLDEKNLPIYQQYIEETAQAFDVDYAQISLVKNDIVHTPASPLAEEQQHQMQAQLPREDSICTHLIYQDADLVIEDIKRDPRFSNNPELKHNHLRFYAGVPLRTSKGLTLGSLCILNKQPRSLEEDDLDLLHQLASNLMQTLSHHKKRDVALEDIEHLEGEPISRLDESESS